MVTGTQGVPMKMPARVIAAAGIFTVNVVRLFFLFRFFEFFLGRAIGDPGALFYIVSNLFRMTPVMLIGLLAAVVLLLLEVLRNAEVSLEVMQSLTRTVTLQVGQAGKKCLTH